MSRTEPEGPRRQGQSHSDLSKRWAHSEDRRRGGPAAVGKGRYICIPAVGPRRSSRPMPLAGLGGPPSKLQAWSAGTGPNRELRQAPCGSTFRQCYSLHLAWALPLGEDDSTGYSRKAFHRMGYGHTRWRARARRGGGRGGSAGRRDGPRRCELPRGFVLLLLRPSPEK